MTLDSARWCTRAFLLGLACGALRLGLDRVPLLFIAVFFGAAAMWAVLEVAYAWTCEDLDR